MPTLLEEVMNQYVSTFNQQLSDEAQSITHHAIYNLISYGSPTIEEQLQEPMPNNPTQPAQPSQLITWSTVHPDVAITSAGQYTGTMTIAPGTSPWLHKKMSNPLFKEKPDAELFYNRTIPNLVSIRGGRKSGRIGLEIECEGTKLFNTPFKWWYAKSDGSLRAVGEEQPVEYVLKQPLDLADLNTALHYLDAQLKNAKSHVMQSTRTSVHVHVNVQDMTLRQLYCYILLYIIFEEILVDWSGEQRAGNLFCLRAKDSEFYIRMLEDVLKKSSLQDWREEVRYSSCNVASVTKFGSLEFRSMEGTVNIQRIMTWVELLLFLRDKSLTYDNPVEIVEEFNRLGPLPFFAHIFDVPRFRNLFASVPGLSGKLWDGLRLMRDVAYSCDWVKPLPKKKTIHQTK